MPSPFTKFTDRSIRGRIVMGTLAACAIALLFTACGLYAFQSRHFRNAFTQELQALSGILAANCPQAVASGNPETALEVLSPLGVKPEITGAGILGPDGMSFAAFGQQNQFPPPAPDAPRGITDHGASWTAVEPIVANGKRIGTFFMNADFAKARGEQRFLFFKGTAAVLACTLLLAGLLIGRLQKFVAGPLRALADAGSGIVRDRDYSVRVDRQSDDEVGALADAFNHTLAQIQKQETTLQAVRSELREKLNSLKREVADRTRAEAAQAKLTAIIDGTPDFVASADTLGRVLYMNPAARRMIGLAEGADVSSMRISDFHPGWAARIVSTEGIPAAVHDGSWAGETAVRHRDGGEIQVSQVVIAHRSATGAVESFSTVMRDISERKAAELALRISQQKLLETSRLAGMAEVATGVLHNVGNVLNSVNVSAGLVLEKVRRSKADKVARTAELLTGHNGSLADYLTNDPNGKKVPGYLAKLGTFLVAENAEILAEVDQLSRNIEHIKEVVTMQQSYAKVSGVFEDLSLDRLVDDAIAMNISACERHGVKVERRYTAAPPVRVDRHRVLQILINLIRNAKYALDDSKRTDKRLVISIEPAGETMVRVALADNGIGISPGNLTRIFGHGFTTRKDGHGFGLHSGANAAKEMNGSLSVTSDGPGLGATFILELPVAQTAAHP